MKTIIAIMAFMMLGQAQAQTNAPGNVPENVVVLSAPAPGLAPASNQAGKKTVAYDERTNELVEVRGEAAGQPAAQPTAQPIYILNNQNQRVQGTQSATQGSTQAQKTAQVQDNPTTVIQEAPLKPSAAEEMRKKRQNSEASTEDTIVQTLEKARMEDEMRRREKFNSAILGPAENNVNVQQSTIVNTQQAQSQVQAAPAPVVVAPAPAPAVIPAPKKEIVYVEKDEEVAQPTRKDAIRSEIRTAIDEVKPEKTSSNNAWVAAVLGLGKYSDTINMEAEATGGVAVGANTSEHVQLEGSFMYGSYAISGLVWGMDPYTGYFSPADVTMKQYNLSGAGKYVFLGGKIRPNVGALVSYVRRSYNIDTTNIASTDGIDAGLLAGLDVQLTDQFAIGGDARYMTNVWTKGSTSFQNSRYQYGPRVEQPEKIDYWVMSVLAKFMF